MLNLDKDKRSGLVQSIQRAFKIIEFMASGPREVTLTSITSALGMHVATVHRILATLISLGLVEQVPGSKKYRLGMKAIELGIAALSQIDLREEAAPYLRRLMESTGETANLVVLDRDEVVYIDKVQSSASLGMFVKIGKRAPIYCTGVGKVLTSEMPEDEVKAILLKSGMERLTQNTICSVSDFLEELKKTRERGYALDNEECEPGARCVAAPLRDHTGRIIAAISVSGPSVRFTDARLPELIRQTIEVAAEISRRMGYRGKEISGVNDPKAKLHKLAQVSGE